MEEVRRVGVIGAGTMGHGIAQVAAQAGYRVRLVDSAVKALDEGLGRIQQGFESLVAKGKISEQEGYEARERIVPSTELASVEDSELVVEAVVEKLEVKSSLLEALDRICPAHTILASNTSSISITRLAATTGRPGKVIGLG